MKSNLLSKNRLFAGRTGFDAVALARGSLYSAAKLSLSPYICKVAVRLQEKLEVVMTSTALKLLDARFRQLS